MQGEGYSEDPGWFLDTRLGRFSISLIALGFVAFLVIWNMPDSEIRDRLRPQINEAVWAIGIGQDWGVFAPNPVSISYRVEADVFFADGSVERYEFPDGDPLVGAYREFRWRKYESRVRRDENRSRWRPTALWVKEQYPDRLVSRVVLIRRTRDVPEPGSDEITKWEDEEMFEISFANPEDRPDPVETAGS
jgi:hypothetical protein